MRIAIIGGGAAGLMCAATILETDPTQEVFLIERNNSLGKKVIVSGGGRCNVTTGIQDVREVLKNYPRGSKFLNSAMCQFSPGDVYNWFETHGVPMKTQEDNRVFPVSDDGHDIVRVFEKLFESVENAHVLLNHQVVGVEKKGDEFEVLFKDGRDPLVVDGVVLATGGQAYRHTGSTGDGYAFATSLGHTLTPLAPSLSALCTKEKWPKDVSGLSFKSATITAHTEKNISFTGPFLFTHKGVSGPAVFALSSLIAFEKFDKNQPLPVTIDLFPELSLEQLREDLEKKIGQDNRKQFKTVLSGFVPKSLVEVMARECSIDVSAAADQTPKKVRDFCASWLKAVPLNVTQRLAGDEFVTAGGVDLTEVNPSSMESTICPGLYFAGEILDIDAFTGGFNLQSSWATGRLAGVSILANE